MNLCLPCLLLITIITAACNDQPGEQREQLTNTNVKIPFQTASNEMKAVSTLQDKVNSIIESNPNKMKTSWKINLDSLSESPEMRMKFAEKAIKYDSVAIDKYFSSVSAFKFDQITSELRFKEEKAPQFINEALPKSFIDRIFIRNLAAFTYDIFHLPGNIVEMLPDSTLQLKTIQALSNKNYVPQQVILDNEIIYDNKINNKASFNGSFVIGGLSVEKDRMMELVIQDVAKSSLPDSVINSNELKRVLKSISAAERKKLYFIKGALLTVINSKKYDKSSYTAKVNTSWLTADGNAFKEANRFSKERLVSLDLVSLDNLIGL